MKNRAVVVGVSNYPLGIQNLPAVAHDVQAIADLLGSHNGSFDRGDVRLLLDADAKRLPVRESLRNCLGASEPEDTVFAYIAGHGGLDENRNFYFVPYDTHPNDLSNTAIPLKEIKGIFDQSKSNRVLLWLDFCYSGAILARGTYANDASEVTTIVERALTVTQGHGKVIMCACTADQRAYESADHGVFTRHLLAGLKGAAVNAAGEVTASSLHDYVDSNMGSAKQRPLFFGEMTGRIVLMHFPKKAKSIPPQKPEAFLSKFIPRRTRQPLEVGVVLGSESLAIGLPDGTILEESALTATEASTNRIVAVGNEAKKLLQQLSSDFIAVRPVKDGAVADYRSAEALLRGCLHNVIKGLPFRVVAAIPSGSTEVEKDALKRALYSTGAFEVDLVETSILAAIGAGLPVQESRGFAVLHCSEDLTEIALIALSGIVYSRTIHIGTNEFDEAIVQYLRQAHSLSVGGRTAQNIRLNIGTAFPLEKQREMIANGRDSVTGMLKSVSITSNQILEAILEPVSTILYYLNEVIIRCPLELSADLAERGLVIAGVGALLPGIDECLALETGLPVRLAPNPLTAVLDGTRLAHDRLPALRQK